MEAVDIFIAALWIFVLTFIGYSAYKYHQDCKEYKKRKNKDIPWEDLKDDFLFR